MDGILDGKPGMTIDELIALLEKGSIKADGEYVLDDSGLKPYSVDNEEIKENE